MTATAFFVRLGRWGLAGFSAIAFAAAFVQTTAFYAVAGHTPATQAAFGASMSAIASRFTAVFPPPLRPDTVGGYVWWRGYQAIALLLAIWALASATAMVRADERRGVVDAVLASGVSRIYLVAQRCAAFAIAVAIASAAAAIGLEVAVRAAGDTVGSGGVVEASLLLVALALGCYGISLLVAQLVAARFATAAAAIVLLALFLANSLGRVFTGLSIIRWLSPFRYLELNQPLAPGGTFDARSAIVLVGAGVALMAGAALAFTRRDLGAPLVSTGMRRHTVRREPSRVPLWRVPVVRELYERRLSLLTWSVGVAAIAVTLVWAAKSVIQPLLSIPTLIPYFGSVVRGDIFAIVLGYVWFNFAELLFAAFAIAHVGRWAAEDGDGRLELVLSQPRSRAGVVVERMLMLAAAATLIAAISGVAVYYASRSQGVEVDQHRLAIASLMLVPFALVFAAAGGALAAWNPRAAVGALGGAAFLGYLDSEVGPLLKWPALLQDVSPFKLFGTPLITGLDAGNLAVLVLMTLIGLGLSILAIERRDVGS